MAEKGRLKDDFYADNMVAEKKLVGGKLAAWFSAVKHVSRADASGKRFELTIWVLDLRADLLSASRSRLWPRFLLETGGDSREL